MHKDYVNILTNTRGNITVNFVTDRIMNSFLSLLCNSNLVIMLFVK